MQRFEFPDLGVGDISYIYLYMYIYIYTCVYVCMYVCICIYIYRRLANEWACNASSSLILELERSSSRTCSQKLWPSFSSSACEIKGDGVNEGL